MTELSVVVAALHEKLLKEIDQFDTDMSKRIEDGLKKSYESISSETEEEQIN